MSGLPSGYTQLEYIESSGTQYVDTGIKPNQNFGLRLKFNMPSGNAGCIAGCDQAWQTNGIIIVNNIVSFGSTASGSNLGLNDGADHVLTIDSGVFAKDGSTIFTGSGTFQAPINFTLFTLNRNGINQEYSSCRIYFCQIYDNGALVRDFVPCKNASGAVGLYNLVGGQFYANAGTGTFTAGPEIPAPEAPTALQTVLAVVLQWAASANADRYDVYRDGAKLGSTETTQYVDTTPEANQTYVYTVKAVNGGGESAGTSITVYTKSGYFEYKPLIESANFP